MTDILSRAVTAIQAGDKATGKRLLIEALKANPNSDVAWVWMSEVCPPGRRQECIERALAINPNNEVARRARAKLEQPAPSPHSVSPESAPKQGGGRRWTAVVLGGVALGVIVLCCGITSLSRPSSDSTTKFSPTKQDSSVEDVQPRVGRLCCVACAEENQLIRLWEHPADNPTGSLVSERGDAVGYVAHNTEISAIKRAWVTGEGRFYYYVIASGQHGWIPQSFIHWGSDLCPTSD